METIHSINYKIDWVSSDDKAVQDRINYLTMLRGLLKDLDGLENTLVNHIFKKWNVHFVDIDRVPRVNIDKPTDEE